MYQCSTRGRGTLPLHTQGRLQSTHFSHPFLPPPSFSTWEYAPLNESGAHTNPAEEDTWMSTRAEHTYTPFNESGAHGDTWHVI